MAKSVPTSDLQLSPLFDQLTVREQQFVLHPEVMTDPIKAAMDVGYAEATARCNAHAKRKSLMFYIRPINNQRFDALGVNSAKIREELAYMAFANITDYYDTVDTETDTIKVWKDPSRLPEHMQRAIKSISYETIVDSNGVQTQVISSIVLHDKQAAIKELGDVLGLKDAKSRPPLGDDDPEDAQLLDSLEPEEIEAVTAMYAKAAARLRAKASKKRDQKALTGVAIRGKNDKA